MCPCRYHNTSKEVFNHATIAVFFCVFFGFFRRRYKIANNESPWYVKTRYPYGAERRSLVRVVPNESLRRSDSWHILSSLSLSYVNTSKLCRSHHSAGVAKEIPSKSLVSQSKPQLQCATDSPPTVCESICCVPFTHAPHQCSYSVLDERHSHQGAPSQ